MKKTHRIRHLILGDTEGNTVLGRRLRHGDDPRAVLAQRGKSVRDDAGLVPTRFKRALDGMREIAAEETA